MSYLQPPLTINQSNHLLKFITVAYDLGLMSESTFIDTARVFDDYILEQRKLSWEPVPQVWFTSNV